MEGSARTASRLLSGYLCGTHSGALAYSRPGRALSAGRAEAVVAAHQHVQLEPVAAAETILGERQWEADEQIELEEALRQFLSDEHIVDLIFFGSQARGARTGFSDVDAILVVADEVAADPVALRRLRPRVLAAEKAVLAYQPMQHHGFEVATPRLMRNAAAAVGLPRVALEETTSLNGRGVVAALSDDESQPAVRLRDIVNSLATLEQWPTHPWKAHAAVSMFELLPTLYLQSERRGVPKWKSFREARLRFPNDWWVYDILSDVRRDWPRHRYRPLQVALNLLRNPWTAVAAWRRWPEPLPREVQGHLTAELLRGLQALARSMVRG